MGKTKRNSKINGVQISSKIASRKPYWLLFINKSLLLNFAYSKNTAIFILEFPILCSQSYASLNGFNSKVICGENAS